MKPDVDPAMWLIHVLHEEALMTTALIGEIATRMTVRFGLKYAQAVMAKIMDEMERESGNDVP